MSHRERAQLRDQAPRAHDAQGRKLIRGTIDSRAVTRAADGDGSIGFEGHAIVFNSPAWIGSKRWGYWEQISPEAVVETIANDDIRMLQNHNPDLLLARNTSGTLRLEADDIGLAVDADMAPTSYAQDLAVLLERQDLTQMSFAFEDEEWTYTLVNDDEPMYTLTKIRMFDVATVTYPAYEDTDAGLRAAAFDVLSRSAGLSARQERDLVEHLARGEEIDPEIVAAIRGINPRGSATQTAPPAPAERSEPPAAEPSGDTPHHQRNERMARMRALRHRQIQETI